MTSRAPAGEPTLGLVLVTLLRGPIYRDEKETQWRALLGLRRRVEDYLRVLGMTAEIDEVKGYAYLRSDIDEDDPDAPPRLIPRRALSYPVSLLLALLRRRLAEHDATSSDAKLVLSRDELVRLIQDFLSAGSTESRAVDRIDAHIKHVVQLGFLRELTGQPGQYEVRRILEAFVDAQWLAEFDTRLAEYAAAGGTA